MTFWGSKTTVFASVLLPLFWLGTRCSPDSSVITAAVFKQPSEIHPGEFDWYVSTNATSRDQAVAYGSYDTDVDSNGGWRMLDVRAGYSSESKYSHHDVMYAAGLLEGYLTQREIYEMYTNLYNSALSNYSSEELDLIKDFYQKQRDWTNAMVAKQGSTDQFWNYTGLIIAQFEGLMEGYAKALQDDKEELEIFAFDFLTGNGDFLDLRKFLVPSSKVANLTYEDYLRMLYEGHCSVLIKFLPGFDNFFASHSTWFSYSSMLRIYKYYGFRLSEGAFPAPATELMSFSSYPGYLSSLDDFYIMDSGLLMLQTTNGIFNKTLYEQVTTQALLAWHRVRLANWLAIDGKAWADYVSLHNSGTYNNQYMVLDLKKMELGKEIYDGALWVVEQIPGYMESADQTAILRSGYWASYNVPFYEDIYNMSGYREAMDKMGNMASYQLCPRAEIFRRDQGKVVDMETMQSIMRYNNYQSDPFAEGNPMKTICSRGDLLDPPMSGGCTDTKITEFGMALELKAIAVNGPTAQGLAPFSWSKSKLPPYNLGQPDTFDYSFAMMAPKDF